MRPSAFAVFSPSPARGGSSTTRSKASFAARSEKNASVVARSGFTFAGALWRQVGERVRRSFDGNYLVEVIGQMCGEEAGAGVKIERGAPGVFADDNFNQLVDEKAIGLEERSAADPVVLAGGVVEERIGADGLRGLGAC